MKRTRFLSAAIALATSSVLLAGCASDATDSEDPTATAATAEQSSRTPRLVVSYDGGLRVLDATTLDRVADLPLDGFLRLNSADDSRHVFVTTAAGFQVLDAGTWTERHGDHSHHRTAAPRFTGMTFTGSEPGHVVPYQSRITLFFDGSGEAKVVDPADLTESDVPSNDYRAPHAHHGVAVSRSDGSLVITQGDQDRRTGVAVLTRDRQQINSIDNCPGVHGEAAAAGGVLTFGCQDGIVIVRGNDIQKVTAPDPYGRIGNQRGAETSPIVLGDYKTQQNLPEGTIERPRRFSLTDTRTGDLRIIDLPTSYSFRSLARGPRGEAVILGTDGVLYVFDADSGRRIAAHPVIDAWSEPVQWQQPMPSVTVLGGIAYVSDPAAQTVHAVDLASGRVAAKGDIGVQPVEIVAVAG